jgi:hypothetical protein
MRAMSGLCVVLALGLGCGKKRDAGEAQGSAAADPAGPAASAEDPPAGDETAADKAEKAKADKAEKAKAESKAAQESPKILAYAHEPMTEKDVEATLQFVKAWRANAINQRFRQAWQDMQDLNKKDDSTAGEMRKTRTITKAMAATDEIEEAFDALIAISGGPERHYARTTRVGAVVAAAEQIAKTAKAGDPQSDRVAELMLEQRGDIAKEFRLAIEEWREAKKRGDDNAPIVTALVQGPGAVALALMPEASFQAWRKLTEVQRQELRLVVNESVTPVMVVMDYPAGGQLFAAAVELAEKTPEALLPK